MIDNKVGVNMPIHEGKGRELFEKGQRAGMGRMQQEMRMRDMADRQARDVDSAYQAGAMNAANKIMSNMQPSGQPTAGLDNPQESAALPSVEEIESLLSAFHSGDQKAGEILNNMYSVPEVAAVIDELTGVGAEVPAEEVEQEVPVGPQAGMPVR